MYKERKYLTASRKGTINKTTTREGCISFLPSASQFRGVIVSLVPKDVMRR